MPYYLSFDCGSKTLAFCLVNIDLSKPPYVQYFYGETINLFPDKKDSEIKPLERLQALITYLKKNDKNLKKIINNEKEDKLTIIVEKQMGQNIHMIYIYSGIIQQIFGRFYRFSTKISKEINVSP